MLQLRTKANALLESEWMQYFTSINKQKTETSINNGL